MKRSDFYSTSFAVFNWVINNLQILIHWGLIIPEFQLAFKCRFLPDFQLSRRFIHYGRDLKIVETDVPLCLGSFATKYAYSCNDNYRIAYPATLVFQGRWPRRQLLEWDLFPIQRFYWGQSLTLKLTYVCVGVKHAQDTHYNFNSNPPKTKAN